MRVREGDDPFHKDKDVAFRTTYYFRVYDFCVMRDRIAGKAIKVPLTDSFYRFRMTGKASTLGTDIRFESGTLKSYEIDSFGANVVFDEGTGEFRFQSVREGKEKSLRAEAEKRRREAYEEALELYEFYKELKDADADPSILKIPLAEAIKARLKIFAETSSDGNRSPTTALTSSATNGDARPAPDNAGVRSKSIECPDDAPQRRGFQILGPEGWRTFDQDERLIMAMSTDASPIIGTLKDLSARVLNARVNQEARTLPFVQERLRVAEANGTLDSARVADQPKSIIAKLLDKFDPED